MPPTRPDPIARRPEAEQADIALAVRAARHRKHPVWRVAGALSQIGDQPPLLALSGTWLAYGVLSGDRCAAAAGGRVLASVLVATALKGAMKRLVSRTRPNVLLEEGYYQVEPLGPNKGPWHSFPSGHTAGSVAAARALARVYPAAWGPAYAGAAAIGLVQIPCGRHYPLDVAAGFLVGLAAEACTDRAIRAAAARAEAFVRARNLRGGAGRPPNAATPRSGQA